MPQRVSRRARYATKDEDNVVTAQWPLARVDEGCGAGEEGW